MTSGLELCAPASVDDCGRRTCGSVFDLKNGSADQEFHTEHGTTCEPHMPYATRIMIHDSGNFNLQPIASNCWVFISMGISTKFGAKGNDKNP